MESGERMVSEQPKDIGAINSKLLAFLQLDPRHRTTSKLQREIAQLAVAAQKAGRFVQLVNCSKCDAHYPLVADRAKVQRANQVACLACGRRALVEVVRRRVTLADGTMVRRAEKVD